MAGVPGGRHRIIPLHDRIHDLDVQAHLHLVTAGGYDAIFVILVSDLSRNAVETVWAATTEMNVGPLLATASSGSMTLEASTA